MYDPAPWTTRLSRRRFITLLAASAALAGCARRPAKEDVRIGLALGGGGARGLAHLIVFETLDALGIRPHLISGTSIGAILGALYAAGHSGSAIRAMVNNLIIEEQDSWKDILFVKEPFKWLDFFDVELGRGGLLDSSGFMAYLGDRLGVERFSQLQSPLTVVAGDLASGEQVLFDRGPLLPAIQASMAIPGLFEPVEIDGRFLVDGGTVNPLPHDVLRGRCDLVIAVDVTGVRSLDNGPPAYTETLFQNFHNMERLIQSHKLQDNPPDIYLKPDIRDVRVLEFHKAQSIFQQSAPMGQALIRALGERIAL